jgi:HTH-type transcriptional regulator, transcriptional repressor of NAD biosynthesis genes
MKKIGLTLGKFAPLHRGHQLVIETALSEMDQVKVLIYDMPDLTDVPLSIRANWIRQLYPQVEVLMAWDGPVEVGDDPALTAMHDAYLIQRMQGHAITHFYSSEFYGEHVSRALGAVDRRVDNERSSVHISATQIRSNPTDYRHFVSPIVYRDLILHVVFLGAPSTGKSTISQAMAETMDTVWVPEYGREYWEANHVERKLTPEQLVAIGLGHRQREDNLVGDAKRFMFVDTDASTTRQFSLYYHGRCDQRLDRLVDETYRRYDLFFLCEPDFPFDDTWDRSGEVSRLIFQRCIESDLIARKLPYIRLGGSVSQRIEKVCKVLESTRKWRRVSLS